MASSGRASIRRFLGVPFGTALCLPGIKEVGRVLEGSETWAVSGLNEPALRLARLVD